MKTVRDIYNEILGEKALIPNSLYAQFGDKLIRFADHKCNYMNILNNNEDVSEVMLVYVNSGMTDNEIQDNFDEVENELNLKDIEVEYLIYNEDDTELDYIKGYIERFLK